MKNLEINHFKKFRFLKGALLLGFLAFWPAGSWADFAEDQNQAKEYLGIAKQRLSAGDSLTAISLAKEALDLDPNLSEAYYVKGLSHYNRGEIDDCISSMEQYLELEPAKREEIGEFLDRIKVESLGQTYYKPGSNAEAANEALEKAKEAWDAGRKAEAEAWIGRAAQLDGNIAKVQFAAGYLYAQKGQFREAEYYYQRAIALDPEYVEAVNNLGLVYLKRGYYDRAIYQFRKAINLDYKTMDSYFNMAEALAQKGDFEAAAEEMVKVIAENDQDIQAHNNLAMFYEELGNITDAMKEWEKVVELGSDPQLKAHAEAHLEKMKIYRD